MLSLAEQGVELVPQVLVQQLPRKSKFKFHNPNRSSFQLKKMKPWKLDQ